MLAVTITVAGCATSGPPPANGALIPVDQRQAITTLAGEDLLKGAPVSLDQFHGDALIINIWGAWCGPCRAEAPELVQAHAESGVDFLGIDVRDHDRGFAEDFARDRLAAYPSLYDPPGRALVNLGRYRNAQVPTTLVLDREHRVAAVFHGGVLAADILPRIREVTAE